MRPTIFITLFLLVSSKSQGQKVDLQIPEPEYIGNVILLKAKDEFIKLEKQKPSIKASTSASTYIVGIGKSKTESIIQGARSTSRTNTREYLSFIVKVINNGLDPAEVISIFPLESNTKKNIRTIETASATSFGSVKSGDISYIPFKSEKYGDSSFLIIIDKVLVPGEYAIAISGIETLSLFGVD
ncbi:MAG: hypothetical protein QXW79_05135 [Thermoplasmata archaeon]